MLGTPPLPPTFVSRRIAPTPESEDVQRPSRRQHQRHEYWLPVGTRPVAASMSTVRPDPAAASDPLLARLSLRPQGARIQIRITDNYSGHCNVRLESTRVGLSP